MMTDLLLHSDHFWLQTFWPVTVAVLCVWLASKAVVKPTAAGWLWRAGVLKLLAVAILPFSIAIRFLPGSDRSAGIEKAEQVAAAAQFGPANTRLEPSPANVGPRTGANQAIETVAVEPHPQIAAIRSLGETGWIVGIGLGLCGLLVQWVVVHRRVHRLPPLADERISCTARQVSTAVGLRNVPPMALDRDAGSPQLVGLFRPTLIFPGWLLERRDERDLRLILAHEFAHAKRRDLVWNLLAAISTTVFFFHPLTWFVRRRLRIAQELAADDVALRTTGVGVGPYADLVLKIVEKECCRHSRQWLAVNAALNFKELSERIERMHSQPKSNALLFVSALILLIAGLVPWHADFVRAAAASETKAASISNTVNVAAGFRYAVRFEQGATRFENGDKITIVEVRGTSPTFTQGHIYWVRGTYNLASHQRAILLASVTLTDLILPNILRPNATHDWVSSSSSTPPSIPGQVTGAELRVQRATVWEGSGEFTLYLPMQWNGYPHISFYTVEHGKGFGGNYFGTDDTVLKQWWGTAPKAKAAAARSDESAKSTAMRATLPSGAKADVSSASKFPYAVRFEQGATRFLKGDSITIEEVRGTAETMTPGQSYWIRGTYNLNSHDRASLSAYTTARDAANGIGPSLDVQSTTIKRGVGVFTLILPMSCSGWPHVSFYSNEEGESFGGNYFGTGDSVLRKWWGSK